MSDERIRDLEREIASLRRLVRGSTQQLVAEAESRGIKKLKRVKKTLLLVCHPDKTNGISHTELSGYFTRAVNEILKL